MTTTPSSADRVLTLIGLLHERGRLRVLDVAGELGVAPSTAHRLLSTLRAHGFAVQDRARGYHPGPAMTAVAAPARGDTLRRAAAPALAELAEATGETVHLMVLEGTGVRFVDGVDGAHALRVARRVGLVLPAHLTSGGSAMLAELSPAELSRRYPTGLPLTPDAAGPYLPALRRRLAAIRRRGYAINQEQTERGVNAIGACVHGRQGEPAAAVVLAAPSIRLSVRMLTRLAGQVVAAAARAETTLRS